MDGYRKQTAMSNIIGRETARAITRPAARRQ
jgi:hypothetical protein